MGIIMFNGASSKDYGIEVEHPPKYNYPERDYTIVHVPGRNGDLVLDSESYQNVERVYELAIGEYHGDFTVLANRLSTWLHSARTYARLEDSYEPEYYRMALYQEGTSIENFFHQGGRVEVTFNCKPQRFLKEGEKAVVTFKWPVGEEAAISAAIKIRGEYNLELKQENFEHWQNELLAREDFHTQVPPELVVLVRENMLFPRYQAIFKRHHAEMRFGTSLLELAIDVGYLQAGQAQEDISELEIELIEGQAEDLTHFCEKVTAMFALQALQESKFTRLLALEKRMLSR